MVLTNGKMDNQKKKKNGKMDGKKEGWNPWKAHNFFC